MNWDVIEAGVTYLEGFSSECLPNDIPSQIKILKKKNTYGFEIGNVVGLVPLVNGDYLRILPKYSGINIVEMMMYVQSNENKLTNNELGKQYDIGDTVSRIEVFIGAFIKSLKIIEERSLKFERQRTKKSLNHVKGSVNWGKTKLNMKKRIGNSIESNVYTPTFDIPENLLLGAAAKKSIYYVEEYSDDWHLLYRWSNRFKSISAESLYKVIDKKLLQNRLSGARAYYQDAIVSAKLILGYYGMGSGDTIEGEALLVNTPDLYEHYVRVGCERILKRRGLFVTKGFTLKEFLFIDGFYELIPDIVVWKGNSIVLVCDVKYKETDSKDYYQLYTYIKKVGGKSGVVFSPCKNSETEPAISSRKTFDGILIYDLLIPNYSSTDLERAVELLIDKKIISY
ncbi:McrC family protein [Virgibacillus halodenitrificans]|uniref:McrC family protein n=1 Tax=Virgibacillus halodenitrificans TaxID=1482 RepID=UPI000B0D86CD